MSTKPKNTRPSSPRDFFRKLYGHLEKKDTDEEEVCAEDDHKQNKVQELVTPVPILATPLPFLLPSGNEAHLTAAAAAGLSAFRKDFYISFISNY